MPKPVGKALKWDDAEIARLAQIGPEDVTAAKAHFARLAPKKIKTLLNAKKDARKPR